jgi:hypothetical protein
VAPWLLADPHAFWRDTVTDFLHLTPRADALTMWLHEPDSVRSALVVVALAGGYLLTWLSCRGCRHRFLLGSAAVLAAFDLMNKQSFFNQWMLVTWLLIAAVALEIDAQASRRAGISSTAPL